MLHRLPGYFGRISPLLRVVRGGTGRATATAYAVLTGGTTADAPHQSVASVGTSGQVLTSNGAAALPTFQTSAAGAMPRAYLAGLKLSNNVTDAVNDIDIAVGAARDSTNAVDIVLAAALTKRLDASWVVGTNQGGLDTGTLSGASGYYVWLIKRSDTSVIDVLFSLDGTAPTMPASYDYKRRIGWVRWSGTAILAFSQAGDRFLYTVSKLDINETGLTTARSLYSVSVPQSSVALLRCIVTHASAMRFVVIQPPDETDAAPSMTAVPLATIRTGSVGDQVAATIEVQTNSAGQVAARANGASTELRAVVLGWIDRRGRDD